MPDVSTQLLSFDRGLYDVSDSSSRVAEAALPQQSKINPSQEPVTNQIADVFADRSFEKGLLNAIRPRVSDPSVMLPQNFSRLIDDVKDEAADIASNMTDRNTRHQFEALSELMSEEAALMHSLMEARNLLLQA